MKKKILAAYILLLCPVLLCACTRMGERDSTDFISSMAKYGFDLTAQEISSGEQLRESYYSGAYKISAFSNSSGKLCRLSLTFAGTAQDDLPNTAKSCIMSFCGFEEAHAQEIADTLGISLPLPDSTMGVTRCESEYYLFSFTVDSAGGCLVIDSLRLNPTSAPTVTVRTTVPQVSATEEASSS